MIITNMLMQHRLRSHTLLLYPCRWLLLLVCEEGVPQGGVSEKTQVSSVNMFNNICAVNGKKAHNSVKLDVYSDKQW